jgi:hypothetical protein
MKKSKFLMKQKLLFSDVFGTREEKEEDEKKDSKNQSKFKEKNNEKDYIANKTYNDTESSDFFDKLKEEFLNDNITIIIYSGIKRECIEYNVNQTISDLIKYLNEYKYLSDDEVKKNNFKILYGLEVLKVTDERKIYKIVYDNKINKSSGDEDKITIIKKAKEKEFIKNKNVEKICISLENIPSFMDLSEQINIFINKHNNEEIKYDIKYKNNCCNIIFLSREISFSFVSFMTNLKFNNKFYRKLRININYLNALNMKNKYLNNSLIIKTSDNNDLLNSIQNNRSARNIHLKNIKINQKLNSQSFNRSRINNYYSRNPQIITDSYDNNDYFNDKYNSIRESTPYEQEKIISKLEKEKNKKKWITFKGFFSSPNKKSFNRYINPNSNNRLFLSIANNKDRKIFLNLNK